MDGVEILNTVYEYAPLIPAWLTAVSILFVMFGIPIGLCLLDHCPPAGLIVCVLAIVAIVLMFIGLLAETDEIIDTTYQVTISDDVNFVEFNEKYEIIDQEGRIYTVRERD